MENINVCRRCNVGGWRKFVLEMYLRLSLVLNGSLNFSSTTSNNTYIFFYWGVCGMGNNKKEIRRNKTFKGYDKVRKKYNGIEKY